MAENRHGSTSGFAEFQRRVIADAALADALAGADDAEAFIARTVALGAAHGCGFDADEVRAALHAARRAWLERNLA